MAVTTPSTSHITSPKNTTSTASRWWQYTLIPLVLAAVTVLFYFPSLHYDFQFDDIANITKHFNIRHHTLNELYFSGTRWISYWLNAFHYSIGKFNPYSYRVGNLIIHTCNGLLVFFITLLSLSGLTTSGLTTSSLTAGGLTANSLTKNSTKKNSGKTNPSDLNLTGSNYTGSSLTGPNVLLWFKNNAFFIALVTGILFLLHPVQTQTVSYVIQGELEGLAAFTILSMVLCLILFVHSTSIMLKALLVMLLCGFAALSTGTKEIAIISPVLLLIVDWFFLSHAGASAKADSSFASRLKAIGSRWWLYALVGAIVIGWYLYYLKPTFFIEIFGFQKMVKNNIGNVITHDPTGLIKPWDFFISQFKVIIHYLAMFIWPFNISVEYDWVLCRSFVAPDCLLPLALLCAIFYGIIRLLRTNIAHPLAFGLIWFFACIAPRSSIIPSPELLVDYKTYTASFGWLFVIACALVALCFMLVRYLHKNAPKLQPFWICLVYTLALTLALGFATRARNTIWSSGMDFWDNMIQNAPKKARAYNNYGVELSLKLGKYKESIPYFKKAIAMDAHYPDPCNNLAVAYASVNRIDDAIQAMKDGLRINPYYPEGYNNLAHMFIQKKEYEIAEKNLRTALQMRPYYGKAFYNLARIRLEQNKPEEAWDYLKKACTQADLDTDAGFATFAKVSFDLKRYADAIWGYTKALELNPNLPEAEFNLANVYFVTDKYAEAETIYQRLLQRMPQDFRLHFNLGETCVVTGRYQEALGYYNRIPKNHPQLAATDIRIANCYEKMGNHAQAQALLQGVVNNPQMPDQLKHAARMMLAGKLPFGGPQQNRA